MKYYPSTLIRKKDLKVNAKACNIFKFTDGPNCNLFMARSGYEENFAYTRQTNEFYFDNFDSITDKVNDVITLSIFKLRGHMIIEEEDTECDISVNSKFEGTNVFEEIKTDERGDKTDQSQDSVSQAKMYFVELCGYCRLVDLDIFSEEMYNFSKKFEPYVQFRKSTL